MGDSMSSVSIAGDTSGSILLAAPAVAGSSTLTLPTTGGTVMSTATTGMVRITSGSVTASSTITVDGCFTSSYLNYVIYVNATFSGSADQDAYFNFRVGGTTPSVAAYPYNTNYINAGVNAGTAASSSGSSGAWILYDNMDDGSIFNGNIQVFNPQTTTKTTAQWFLYGEDNGNFKQMLGFGFQSQSTTFDGFVITMQSGTLTGTYDVYGVAR
jgi:hypothetical protein